MKPIKLGRKSEFISPVSPVREEGVEYPCTCLEGGKELSSLPDKGEITFRFKRKSVTQRSGEDDESTSLCLELQEVLGAEAGSALKSTDEAMSEIKGHEEDED
jgi:hypothetical protein